MNAQTDNERFIRQKDIVPPEKLARCKPTIVGVGAIGRQVALQLAAMGVPCLQLLDFDTVEIHNLASQGYLEESLSTLKVNATAQDCWRINGQVDIVRVPERFKRSTKVGNVVFCAVDKIETRKLLWDSVKDQVECWVDGRMSAEVLRVLTACDPVSRKHYPTTLFSAEEAHQGTCTAKTTIYCANIAAGLMIAQFAKWLRNLPIDSDIQFNLLTSELTVTESH
ncbi:MAG: ThiF family adenylyltransferase [Phycisphaerae bacterium]